jgi:hypothetical protein
MLLMFQVLVEAGMAVLLVAAAAVDMAVAVDGREDSVGVGTAAVVGDGKEDSAAVDSAAVDTAVVDTAVAVDGREDSAVVVTVAEADMAEAVVVVK